MYTSDDHILRSGAVTSYAQRPMAAVFQDIIRQLVRALPTCGSGLRVRDPGLHLQVKEVRYGNL